MVVKELVGSDRVDVNAKDGMDRSPLSIAVRHGNIDVVQILLSHPSIDVNTYFSWTDESTEEEMWTPLAWTANKGNIDIVKELLKKPGLELNRTTLRGQDDWKWTPLQRAAMAGHVEVVAALLGHKELVGQAKLDVNATDLNGDTALHLIAGNGDSASLEITQALLSDERTAFNQKNDNGKTPLDLANEADWGPEMAALICERI